ncbi:MAG: TonB-dependent receptor plug domain-containing protein [Proteobacteria bacterium]|nr:TonB-dependent receptor plug domain-containing protein [Pseudomonadota bacterium]
MHYLRLSAALGFAGLLTCSARYAAAADTLTLEEVTVTAQKRTENLQDVPATMSVVGADAISALHATQLSDIGAYVPGLQVDSGGAPGQTTLSIRGISPISANATVGSYIDDTPIGSTGFHDRGGSYALDLLPYDVRQIEVLSGPQGTLYGANALGGLIKYDLTTPSLDSSEFRVGGTVFGVDHSSGVGSGFRGYANTMLIPDKLGMIASVGQERTPGYIDNVDGHHSDQNSDLQRSARLGLLWQITDAASLKINGLYANTESDGTATVALDASMRPLGGDLTDNNLRPNVYDNTLWYFAATLNWKLPFADFVSATSWSKKSDRFIQDATYTYQSLLPLLGGPADGTTDFPLYISAKRFSQEWRLSSNTHGAVDWLVGLYYDYEKGTNTQFLRTFDANGNSLASLGIDPLFAAALPTIYREYSGFANATWHASSRWDFGGGVRYARNVQGFSQIIEPGSPILPPSNIPGKSAEGVTTWLGRTNFKFTDQIMGYGLVSTGYQAGGPNTSLPDVPPSVSSSKLTNYEVGLKSTLLDGRAIVNLSAFDLVWKRIQVPGSLPSGITYVANGSGARSRGVQIESTIKLMQGLVLRTNGSYTDAILTDDAPSAFGYKGDRLPLVPQVSGSVRLDYDRPAFADWSFHAGTGVRYTGRRYSVGLFALDGIPTAAYTALDANTDLSNSHWTFRLFAKNLTDKRAYLSAFNIPDISGAVSVQNEATVLQPRTLGLAVDYKF